MIEGIQKVSEYRYLGLTVTHGKRKMQRLAKELVEKQVKQLGSAVSGCVQNLKDLAYKVFIRARLQYQMVPLIAADVFTIEGAVNLQNQLLKKFLRLPNDIKGNTVSNVLLNDRRPMEDILREQVARCKGDCTHAGPVSGINWLRGGKCYVRKGHKLWLTGEEQQVLFSVLRYSTCSNFNQTHYCEEHKVMVDRRHFLSCGLLRIGAGDPAMHNRLLEQQRWTDLTLPQQVTVKLFVGAFA